MAKNNNLTDFVVDIADAIREKEGSTDKINPQDFHDRILAIKGAEETPIVEEKDVNFYDYDGTLLFSYTIEEAQALTELPTPPSHEGLVFDGWNWDYEDVIAFDYPMDIGALYTTEDGSTRLFFNFLDDNSELVLKLSKWSGNSLVVNWGDGNSETIVTTGQFSLTHIYVQKGKYIVTIISDADFSTDNQNIFGDILYNDNARLALYSVFAGEKFYFANDAFCFSANLEYVAIPKRIGSFPNAVFDGCAKLKWVSLPQGVVLDKSFSNCGTIKVSLPKSAKLNTYVFQNCLSLTQIVLSDDITTLGVGCYQTCCNVRKFIASKRLNSIGVIALGNMSVCRIFDFRRCEQVPSLANVNALSNLNAQTIIVVPDSLYDAWVSATNWSTYADKIVKSSEYTE